MARTKQEEEAAKAGEFGEKISPDTASIPQSPVPQQDLENPLGLQNHEGAPGPDPNAKGRKRTVMLRQEPFDRPQLPDKVVSINGKYTAIKRGIPVEVSEELYFLLLTIGEVAPQEEAHIQYVPVSTVRSIAQGGQLSEQQVNVYNQGGK